MPPCKDYDAPWRDQSHRIRPVARRQELLVDLLVLDDAPSFRYRFTGSTNEPDGSSRPKQLLLLVGGEGSQVLDSDAFVGHRSHEQGTSVSSREHFGCFSDVMAPVFTVSEQRLFGWCRVLWHRIDTKEHQITLERHLFDCFHVRTS
jgi:hypothetical protein